MIFDCEHRKPTSPDDQAVEAAKLSAAALCISHGDKWTHPRDRIFGLMVRIGGPVKAYELITDYRDGAGLGNSTTVYDTLHYFVRRGFIQRVETLKQFVICATLGQPSDTLLICECCGHVGQADAGIARLGGQAAEAKCFTISAMCLELRGTCDLCQPVSRGPGD